MQRPQSSFHEIHEARHRIKDALYHSYVLDEVATERLKRRILKELENLNNKEVVRAALYHELAYALGVQGRYADAVRNIAIAKKLAFDPIGAAMSHAHIALINGRALDAREVLESEFVDADENVLRLIKAHQVQAGVVGGHMKMAGVEHLVLESAVEVARILDYMSIDDRELTVRLDTACRVIRANISHPIMGYKLFARQGEGILYRFVVKSSAEDLASINGKILDALMAEHDGPIDPELSILVTPFSMEDPSDITEAYRVGIR
ncbi:hypothetical protein [Pseudomonas sp. ICMP 10191]|uniref:hypothetical protein n=1 Tax=Pseudomonas sp. ICMP 10191 TaxID=1198294 RepID=UPI0007302214|nr:hypothetical protein [Pseudomonas sp. ICMP 10191]KTB96556.1 hypothetical protein AO388_26500 [Pseudomonas sp. ICMP 10191]